MLLALQPPLTPHCLPQHETRAVRGITEACTEPLAPALSMVRGVDGVDGASRQDALTATSEVVAGMDILGRLGDRLRALSNRDRRLALATQVVGALVRAFVEGLVPHVSSWRGRPLVRPCFPACPLHAARQLTRPCILSQDWDPWCRAVNGVDVVLDAMRELADDVRASKEAHASVTCATLSLTCPPPRSRCMRGWRRTSAT